MCAREWSHMRVHISPGHVVGVFLAVFHEALAHELVHDEEERHKHKRALPHRLVDQVPHLSVQPVHLLHALQVARGGGGVGHSPHAQGVHVRHVGPRVLELDVLALLHLVDEAVLADVGRGTQAVLELLVARAEEVVRHLNK